MIKMDGITLYNDECAKVMRENIADESIDLVVTSPPYDCYTDDTEILTKNGWKLIKDVSLDEDVMTLNPETKEIYYQSVINTYNYKFDGDLIRFKNEDIDLLVTKNHNMFITDKKGNACLDKKSYLKRDFGKYTFLRKAENINSSCYIPYKGYKWNGKRNNIFVLPEVKCIYNKQYKTFKAKKIDMLQWVRFLGIYLAEGSCRNTKNKSKRVKTYEISIKQKDIKIVDLIRKIFYNLPFNFKEYVIKSGLTVFSITNRQLWDYLFQLGNSFEKYIPEDIKDLSVDYLRELLFYMMLGDGTKKNNKLSNIDDFCNYKSVSKKLKNDVQECLLKIGKLNKECRHNIISNKQYSFIKYTSMDKNYEYYNGNVVCVEVPEHNIICVRRNGKVVFSGNSLRDYNGYVFDFPSIANQLTRVLKPGGVLVWVVGDEVVDRSETGTSFRQALFFQSCGLKIHDTMIYRKNSATFPARRTSNRYSQVFEYMFIFSKGKPKTAKLICDKKNKWSGYTNWGEKTHRNRSGDLIKTRKIRPIPEYSPRENIWKYNTGAGFGTDDKEAFEHPATFPDKLAADHILTWSNPEDVVLDPMMGSGTTGVMSIMNGRQFIGIEISEEYFEICKKRLRIQERENIKLREQVLGI